MIKAIEKCSLQATFGPEITSTKDLLPKKVSLSSGVSVKASHSSANAPVKEHASSNRTPSILAKFGSLFRKSLTKDKSVAPNNILKSESEHVVPTNQHGNIPSEVFTNGRSVPALSACENGVTPFALSNFHQQVPPEVWSQKVSYRVRILLSVSLADNMIPAIRLKSSANGLARKEFFAMFTTYLIQITNIQTMTASGNRQICSASGVPKTP